MSQWGTSPLPSGTLRQLFAWIPTIWKHLTCIIGHETKPLINRSEVRFTPMLQIMLPSWGLILGFHAENHWKFLNSFMFFLEIIISTSFQLQGSHRMKRKCINRREEQQTDMYVQATSRPLKTTLLV